MNTESQIFVTGHNGMLGSALIKLLKSKGFPNILIKQKSDLDLRDEAQVGKFMNSHEIDYVFHTAAKVGGIKANMTYPVEFLLDNITIQNNMIKYSYQNKVKKLLFLGSSCVYPTNATQPMKEESLFTGPLEPTNEGYAIAKIAGLKLLEYYYKQYGFNSVCLMPCNLYGINDDFNLDTAHVLSSLVKRFIDAVEENNSEIVLWGTGNARREFMHVDDMASACLYFMGNYSTPDIINVGWGTDVSIKELANLIAGQSQYKGKILWDTSKPDGMLKKCLEVSRMKKLGFTPKITLEEGIKRMIAHYREIKSRSVS